MVIVASSGQSNAVGRGAGGWPSAVFDSRIQVWNNVSGNAGDGSAFVAPELGSAPFYTTPAGAHAQNPSLALCHRIAQETQQPVKLLHVAKGATPLEEWANNSSAPTPMSDAMIRIHALTGCGPVSVMMHAGHEGNVGSDYAEQRALFLALFARYEAEGVCDSSTIYLLTGTAELSTFPLRSAYNDQVLRRLAAENSRIFYADSAGLLTFDGTHFTGLDLIRMGYERCWTAISGLITVVDRRGPEVLNDYGKSFEGEWFEYSSGRLEQSGIAYLEYVNSQTMRGVWKFPKKFISAPMHVSHAIIGDALTNPKTITVSDANWMQINMRLLSSDSVEIRLRNLNYTTAPFVVGDYLMLSMGAIGRSK